MNPNSDEAVVTVSNDVPVGLRAGGADLWRAVDGAHDLDATQLVQLVEACRAKDRLDRLDKLLRGDTKVWARLIPAGQDGEWELKIDAVLMQANATANLMKQLLAALRLPDEKGKRPQVRSARGVYNPRGAKAPGERIRSVS